MIWLKRAAGSASLRPAGTGGNASTQPFFQNFNESLRLPMSDNRPGGANATAAMLLLNPFTVTCPMPVDCDSHARIG